MRSWLRRIWLNVILHLTLSITCSIARMANSSYRIPKTSKTFYTTFSRMPQPALLLSLVWHLSNFSRMLMMRTASSCRLAMTSTPGRPLPPLGKQMKFLLRWQLIINRQALLLSKRRRLIWLISKCLASMVSLQWDYLQANSSYSHSCTTLLPVPLLPSRALFLVIGQRKTTMLRHPCSRITSSQRLDQAQESSTWARKILSQSINLRWIA